MSVWPLVVPPLSGLDMFRMSGPELLDRADLILKKQPPVKMSDGEVGASGYYERACEGCEPQSRPGEGAKFRYTFWASREQILNGQFPLWTTCSGIDVA